MPAQDDLRRGHPTGAHRPRRAPRGVAISSLEESRAQLRQAVEAGRCRFERARIQGLNTIDRDQCSGHLARVIGEVAEAVAEIVLAEHGYNLFWQITTASVRGVDLLFLSPDDSMLALEVKGTLRSGPIPRLTPSRLRQVRAETLGRATAGGERPFR